MEKENLVKYKLFRDLCIKNSEDALKAAELLLSQKVNHIVFHLSVLILEEIGKIFISFQNIDAQKDEVKVKIPLDDHIKKIFWAIWGPTFMEEKITKQQLDDIKNIASKLHSRRLEVLYTEQSDSGKLSEKITDEEAIKYLDFAKARLELAKVEGEIDENYEPSKEINWFIGIANIPTKRAFIFGDTAQEKLIEFGNTQQWLLWLKEHFENEENSLQEILSKELERQRPISEDLIIPKWKMKFTIISQSHSIRQNIFEEFNKRYGYVKLNKGGDNHTLIIEAIFGNSIAITELWSHGIIFGKLFVAALNISSNGLFYWNLSVNMDKYYDKIWDIENNVGLSAKLNDGFRIKWEEKQMVLSEEHLHLSIILFEYFNIVYGKQNFESVNDYIDGLGMFAKTDIHLRLEKDSFLCFYNCFINALKNNEKFEKETKIKDVGYGQIEKMIKDRTEFDKVMDLGEKLKESKDGALETVSLTEVIGIKMYSGIYLMTLAIRELKKDNTIRLTSEA
jgi:AbiV family abortive infection protein